MGAMTEKHNTWFGQIRYLVFVKRDNIPNERINFLLEYMQAKYRVEKESPWYDSPTRPNYEENYD